MSFNSQHLALLAILATALHWLFARSYAMKWFWDLRWWPTQRCKDCGKPFVKVRSPVTEKWIVVHSCEVDPRLGHPLLRDQLMLVFASLIACTACAGWWLGLAGGFLGLHPLLLGTPWLDGIGSALSGVVVVPILEGALIWGLKTTRIE